MMHKIKKATTSVKAIENAEFSDYKSRLDNLSSYLRSSSGALNESEKAWKEVCNRQKVFAEQFANRYPDKDKVRQFGKESSAASQALVKEFVLRTEGSTAAHWQVDAVVQEFLTEIAEVAGEYKAVNAAVLEVSMYTKKVDDLHNAKKPDETKLTRNMEKLETEKKNYDDLLDRVVEDMKRVYNKRQVALKATYVAYWSSQLRAFNLLDAALEPTRAFVQESIAKISSIKIKTMQAEDVAEFIAENASPATPTSTTAVSPTKEAAVSATKAVPTSPVETTPEAPAEPTATAI